MDQFAIWAHLEAKPGKEQEVAAFLKSALPLAQGEAGTTTWYAVQLSPSTFGIYDTFPTEADRNAHVGGPIAKALFAKADELLAKAPEINMLTILASKAPGGA